LADTDATDRLVYEASNLLKRGLSHFGHLGLEAGWSSRRDNLIYSLYYLGIVGKRVEDSNLLEKDL
jgi:hypothetical protein